MIPQERKDAFFAQIKYPVFGAAAMSTKMLEAQKSTLHLSGKLRHDFMDPRKSINGCLCQKH